MTPAMLHQAAGQLNPGDSMLVPEPLPQERDWMRYRRPASLLIQVELTGRLSSTIFDESDEEEALRRILEGILPTLEDAVAAVAL